MKDSAFFAPIIVGATTAGQGTVKRFQVQFSCFAES